MNQYALFLLILPVCAHASTPAQQNEKRFRYTVQQLKDIKPPLAAQQFTLKPKRANYKTWRPPLLTAPELVQSPHMERRMLRNKKPTHTPHTSVDMTYISAAAKTVLEPKTSLNKTTHIPFPEIIITFEELK